MIFPLFPCLIVLIILYLSLFLIIILSPVPMLLTSFVPPLPNFSISCSTLVQSLPPASLFLSPYDSFHVLGFIAFRINLTNGIVTHTYKIYLIKNRRVTCFQSHVHQIMSNEESNLLL